MIERKPIRFSAFEMKRVDNHGAYRFVNPKTGRKNLGSSWRWMHVKANIAENALWTGAEVFEVVGGVGARRWRRTVTVTQEEAREYLEAAAARSFLWRGRLKRALAKQAKRLGVTA